MILRASTIVIAILAFALVGSSLPPDQEEFMLVHARRVFGEVRMERLSDRDSIERVLQAARWSESDAGRSLPEDQREQLIAAAASFLFLHANGTSSEYSEWRRALGWKWMDRPMMLENNSAKGAYEEYAGKPYDESLSNEAIFESVWTHMRDNSRMVSIASDSAAMILTVKHSDAKDDSWPHPPAGIPLITNFGNMVGFGRDWFVYPNDRRTRTAAGESVLDATLITIAEFADGRRLPIGLRYFHEPQHKRWQLESAIVWFHRARSNKFDMYDLAIEF